jgi:transcriptional regulator with XRE-family HTH domain
MENRKKLGLTQDQLAEKLGVTAQAVSKWENDLSCPDITMLPKLAEIFGTTTDTLLGWQAQPVHQAEVVSDDEDDDEDEIPGQNGNWEFMWESGRKDTVFFAVFVLLVGGLMLAAKLLSWNVSFWEILWPCALLMYGLRRVFHSFSFLGIGCTLFGGYFLLENLGITQLNLAGELIFPILIVIFGLSLLADALRKPKRGRFRVTRDGAKICDENGNPKKGKNEYATDGESFNCNFSFCESTQVVNLPLLSDGNIVLSFGELKLDLTGCEKIADGCELYANCSFGELEILVPKRYRVVADSNTTFASMEIEGEPDPNPIATIHIEGNVTFGEITIQYV